jgi:hypothetical protein
MTLIEVLQLPVFAFSVLIVFHADNASMKKLHPRLYGTFHHLYFILIKLYNILCANGYD